MKCDEALWCRNVNPTVIYIFYNLLQNSTSSKMTLKLIIPLSFPSALLIIIVHEIVILQLKKYKNNTYSENLPEPYRQKTRKQA